MADYPEPPRATVSTTDLSQADLDHCPILRTWIENGNAGALPHPPNADGSPRPAEIAFGQPARDALIAEITSGLVDTLPVPILRLLEEAKEIYEWERGLRAQFNYVVFRFFRPGTKLLRRDFTHGMDPEQILWRNWAGLVKIEATGPRTSTVQETVKLQHVIGGMYDADWRLLEDQLISMEPILQGTDLDNFIIQLEFSYCPFLQSNATIPPASRQWLKSHFRRNLPPLYLPQGRQVTAEVRRFGAEGTMMKLYRRPKSKVAERRDAARTPAHVYFGLPLFDHEGSAVTAGPLSAMTPSLGEMLETARHEVQVARHQDASFNLVGVYYFRPGTRLDFVDCSISGRVVQQHMWCPVSGDFNVRIKKRNDPTRRSRLIDEFKLEQKKAIVGGEGIFEDSLIAIDPVFSHGINWQVTVLMLLMTVSAEQDTVATLWGILR